MKSNRELVSNIYNDLKALSIDDWISPRFIVNKAIDVAGDFIKKENDSRRIYKVSEGWKEIECMPLVEVPISTCPELDTYVCKRLMRSKFKIPDTFSTRYGNLIKYVASLNFAQEYDPITPRQYRAIMNREFIDYRKKYYFFIGGFLYIPDSNVEVIRIEAYYKKPWEVDSILLDNCVDCDTPECIPSPLDYEFVCPEYLFNSVKQEVIRQLREVYLQVRTDNYPNLDSGQKEPVGKQPKE